MYASHNLENWCVYLLDRKKFHHLRAIKQKNESSMSEERLAKNLTDISNHWMNSL